MAKKYRIKVPVPSPLLRKDPLFCMNIHIATQNLCVMKMRNISRVLIPLLSIVYPITRKCWSQIQILDHKGRLVETVSRLHQLCFVYILIQITMCILFLNLDTLLLVDVLVLRCARSHRCTVLVLMVLKLGS